MKVLDRKFFTLADIYAVVPDVNCQGLCTDYCGPVLGSLAELDAAEQAGVDLTKASVRWMQLSKSNIEVPIPKCPALVNGQCSIYAVRPLICRIWGATVDMACPYGCTAQRLLSTKESRYLILEASRLGGSPFEGS